MNCNAAEASVELIESFVAGLFLQSCNRLKQGSLCSYYELAIDCWLSPGRGLNLSEIIPCSQGSFFVRDTTVSSQKMVFLILGKAALTLRGKPGWSFQYQPYLIR